MPMNKALVLLFAFLAPSLVLRPAVAEPVQPPPVDAAQDAAKRAFEALPEGDRKAIQDGLIWTGDYKGIADGRWGKGTREAIVAFAQRSKLPTDGTLDDKGRAALATAAQHAKTAVRFSPVTDERSAIRIGVPLKLLTKISPTKTGARYASADNNAALETILLPESATTLEQKFEVLRAETAQRKVTYKVSRPDFFVVVGETAGTTFYTRFSRGERNGEKMIAGYTLTYPAAAKATYDMIAIAVANSFEPFAGKPEVAVAEHTPERNPAEHGTPERSVPEHSPTDAAPSKPYLAANGLVVAAGLVVTSLPANNCREVQIGAHGAKIAQQEKTSGLALIEAANLAAPAVPWHDGALAPDTPVVMLAYAAKAARPGTAADDLVAAPGELRPGPAGLRVSAASEGVRAGTVVFDSSGAVVGLVTAASGPDKRIGDVAPVTSKPMVDAAALAAFLGAKRSKATAAQAATDRSLGDIVAENRAAVVAVYCVP